MTNLDKLIAAVEAGDADFLASDGWIEAWDTVAPSLQTYRMKSDGKSVAIIADKAYNGSLDAALRLHEVLFPGWVVENLGNACIDSTGGWNVRLVAPDYLETFKHSTANSATPARSWLLAILRALKDRGDA